MAKNPSRADLELAARQYFDLLRTGVDQPRTFDPDNFDDEVALAIEAASDCISALDNELLSNQFGYASMTSADEMLKNAGIDPHALDPRALHQARQLACRALRAQWDYYRQVLSNPVAQLDSADALFRDAPLVITRSDMGSKPRAGAELLTLQQAVTEYLAMKKPTVGQSQLAEVARALEWLGEALGETVSFALITKDQLRNFRDDLTRIDVTLRGRKRPFKDRLTNIPKNRIKSQSYLRYWKSVQAFFVWAASEGLRDDDPAATLKLAARREDEQHSPEPFDKAELYKLFATPIFAGYRPPKSFLKPGNCHEQGGHWWFSVLAIHTGLRAGEISQLLPDDFDFTGDVPHVKVREVDASGKKMKQAKTKASIRDVPLHQNLIDLGLAKFVARQRKRAPTQRVFSVFLLGHRDRVSDGATRFWGKYLRAFGLHKPGRSTHVFRHTFTAALRNAGAVDEDIGALLGHAGTTITSGYGGGQSLARKAKTIAMLDFGFDVVKVLQDQLGKSGANGVSALDGG